MEAEMRGRRLVVILGLLASAATAPALAATTLKGVSCFPEKTYYSQRFEDFVQRINERGKGALQIRYLGGAPKVMATFDVGKNLKDGVVDIATCTAGFYTNIVPEIDAIKMVEFPAPELRKNSALDYLDKIHRQKMNARYLGLVNNYGEFHLYLNKELAGPDLTGLKIRVSPIYRAMVEKLGGTAITSAPADVYTMLERGTVDGYGWPAQGIFDFSWQKVTKYRVDPGFYRTEMNFLVNLDAWNKLSSDQRGLIETVVREIETEDTKEAAVTAEQRKLQEEAGIKSIRFSAENEKKYVATAREAAWEVILKNSPEHGPKLKELFTRK
jgi:TRAP-type transport system periplasmic protein